MVFWGMKPCTFVGRHQSFESKYCVHFIFEKPAILQKETTAIFFKVLVPMHQTKSPNARRP